MIVVLAYLVMLTCVFSSHKSACINGMVVSVELNGGTGFPIFTRDSFAAVTGVAETHQDGCIVDGHLYD